ncbi:MAG: Ku protein [Saprospiraceae bacterium]
MRSIWKGHIQFSLVTIPIQVFNAVENKNNVKFNQLHKDDNSRVSYKKICRSCKATLKKSDIVKGFEYAEDQYVVFTQDELNAIKLKSTRTIEIDSFVDINEVPPSRFEAVYYVGPHGEVAKKTFSLLANVLKKTKKAGIGRIILRDREDVVLITAEGEGLVMYKMRYPYEMRDIKEVPDLDGIKIDDKQLKLAETLVESLTTSFDKIDFEDRYRGALMDMVQEKIDGKQIISITEQEADITPVVDIMDALKASIEEAKTKKSA